MHPLLEIARIFGWFGVTAFGGPAAHIAFFEDEFVDKRKWLDREHFLDLLSATHLVPGPNSTEMAIHIGFVRAGYRGAIAAGGAFIAPAFLLVSIAAWAYVAYGTLPTADAVLYGIKPVVVAIIAIAGWRLGKSAIKSIPLGAIVIIIGVLALFTSLDEVWLLLGAGVVSLLLSRANVLAIAGNLVWAGFPLIHIQAAEKAPAWWEIFQVFFKIGAILFGSGYVLIAYLDSAIVKERGWLTAQQLLDAIAVGQITPGPVLTTSAFVGFLLQGPVGAVVATAGIFLPSFLIVFAMGPLIPRLRDNDIVSSFLKGVNAAVVALIAAVCIEFGRETLVDPVAIALAAGAFVAQWRYGVSGAWLVIVGALVGLLVR